MDVKGLKVASVPCNSNGRRAAWIERYPLQWRGTHWTFRVRRLPRDLYRGMIVLCVCSFMVNVVAASPYIILKNGKKISGTDIRAKSNGDILLTTSVGVQTFVKGQYAKAVADKPKTYEQAKKLFAQKQYDKAIPLLDKIAKDYRNLGWDQQALKLLGEAYLGKEDSKSAISTYEKLFRQTPQAEQGEAKWGYFQALLKGKESAKLERKLGKVIRDGTSDETPQALVIRGDVRASEGNSEGSFLDYMRAILFGKGKKHRPEALYKAGTSLEKLRDKRAKNLFQRLVKEYPSSSWASKAQSKI
ncbi:MAG: outer membrane protein assembly factor BamD [Kiritimatiellae bacterium]|nr:outer membrane protein assembly factor BamD [Kiritimatiellia bacterium]